MIVRAFSAMNNRSGYNCKITVLVLEFNKLSFSPRWGETPFGPHASLLVSWNCAFFLWGVRLLLRGPSSCSSTWWSCRRHPRRCPPQMQAGAWGTWLSSWCCSFFSSFFPFGSPHGAAARPLGSNSCESDQSGLTTQSVRAAPADLLSLWLTGCSTIHSTVPQRQH